MVRCSSSGWGKMRYPIKLNKSAKVFAPFQRTEQTRFNFQEKWGFLKTILPEKNVQNLLGM